MIRCSFSAFISKIDTIAYLTSTFDPLGSLSRTEYDFKTTNKLVKKLSLSHKMQESTRENLFKKGVFWAPPSTMPAIIRGVPPHWVDAPHQELAPAVLEIAVSFLPPPHQGLLLPRSLLVISSLFREFGGSSSLLSMIGGAAGD